MAGPLKKTGLRSSPEDAAFYKQFHDSTLASLRKGTPRADVLRDMVGKGVPEKTAERIVVAVEMELSTVTDAQKPRFSTKKALGFTAVIWVAVAGYFVWRMTRGTEFHAGYLIAAVVIGGMLTARSISRLGLGRRESDQLPPPPNP